LDHINLTFESPVELREYVEDNPTKWGFDSCELGIEIFSYDVNYSSIDLNRTAIALADDLDVTIKGKLGVFESFPNQSVIYETEDLWGYQDECNDLDSLPYLIGLIYLEQEKKYIEVHIDCFQIGVPDGQSILNSFQKN